MMIFLSFAESSFENSLWKMFKAYFCDYRLDILALPLPLLGSPPHSVHFFLALQSWSRGPEIEHAHASNLQAYKLKYSWDGS